MPTLYLMVGIPASGKSTYAASLNCQIVCPDAIRETYPPMPEREVFAKAKQKIQSALKAGKNVVLDATNVLRCWRADVIGAGRPYASKIVCIWMDTPLEICISRHQERVKLGIRTILPVEVIKKYNQWLTDNPPDYNEGFDEIRKISVKEKK